MQSPPASSYSPILKSTEIPNSDASNPKNIVIYPEFKELYYIVVKIQSNLVHI